MTPAAWGAVDPTAMVQALTSFKPAVNMFEDSVTCKLILTV